MPSARCKYLREAEVSEPESNWELQEILGLAAFVLGFLGGKRFISQKIPLIGELQTWRT
jgi:hypothetical protein